MRYYLYDIHSVFVSSSIRVVNKELLNVDFNAGKNISFLTQNFISKDAFNTFFSVFFFVIYVNFTLDLTKTDGTQGFLPFPGQGNCDLFICYASWPHSSNIFCMYVFLYLEYLNISFIKIFFYLVKVYILVYLLFGYGFFFR